VSLPLTLRDGVPVRGGAGLAALFAPGGIAGEAGLSGVLSVMTTSLAMSGTCAAGLAVEVGVVDC